MRRLRAGHTRDDGPGADTPSPGMAPAARGRGRRGPSGGRLARPAAARLNHPWDDPRPAAGRDAGRLVTCQGEYP